MGLYDENGYYNREHILSKGAWLNVFLGARQVGKTYMALRTMLENNFYHILLRRTSDELDTIITSPDLDPYLDHEPEYHVGLFRQGSKMCRIADYEINEDGKPTIIRNRGIATSLPEVGKIRGFNGSKFTDLVYDEFIPEKGVIRRKAEGDMFANAYTTFNGNRELKGLPPLRVWLLANTNDINSPILEILNLTDDVLKMRRKGQEELLTDNGVYIVQSDSDEILDKRKQTAFMKQVDKKSDFYGMAIKNEFSYDDSPYIKQLSVKFMKPAWSYDGFLYCWENADGYYICRAPFKAEKRYQYDSSSVSKQKLALDWGFMKVYYFGDLISFSDLRLLATFKNIFDIK